MYTIICIQKKKLDASLYNDNKLKSLCTHHDRNKSIT